MYRKRRPVNGFTLIEMLAVVAIITLLISILLPSLIKAREQAREAKCKTHIRQLGIGITMYLNQYNVYPAHQWILYSQGTGGPELRIRWYNAMARLLGGFQVQSCPSVADWEVGRNNAYGYNYKYIGSARDNVTGPKAPLENFPVKAVKVPARTIAFADSDGTGWIMGHRNGVNDPEMFGNHGYTLDPTFIPTYSLHTYSGGVLEPFGWKMRRTYISNRHSGGSSACFADGHVERVMPRAVYRDNSLWNGLGREDPDRDPHVSYRCDASTPGFRYDLGHVD